MLTDDELSPWLEQVRAPHGSLTWTSFRYRPHVGANRRWTADKDERYRATGAVAVSIAAPEDVSFVRHLPGLLSFRVLMYLLKDDTAVFDAQDLQQVHLLDRCRKPLRADLLRDLVDLQIDRRPGLETLCDHPNLRLLTIYGHNQRDMAWLGAPRHLLDLHLVGTRRPIELSGIEEIRSLRTLSLQAFRFHELGPVAACAGLRQLVLEGTDKEELDLAPLASLRSLRSLSVQRMDQVRNVEALMALPELEELNLWRSGAQLSDSLQTAVGSRLRRNLERNLAGRLID